MKFEKFFKMAGTHGEIVKQSPTNWLVCSGIGMSIPLGVNNFGKAEDPDEVFHAIMESDPDDPLELKEAILEDADGRANDIIRVFETVYGERIGISNASYGLLEKTDLIYYLEIEDDIDENEDSESLLYMTIVNQSGDLIGFIRGREI